MINDSSNNPYIKCLVQAIPSNIDLHHSVFDFHASINEYWKYVCSMNILVSDDYNDENPAPTKVRTKHVA